MDSSSEFRVADDQILGLLAVGDGIIDQSQLDRLIERQAILYAQGQDLPFVELLRREHTIDEPAIQGLEERGTRLGGYQLICKLGKGGMGSVYRAVRLRDDEQVAVKLLARKRSSDKKFLKRFIQEARMLARIQHPHVVRSLEFDKDRGYYFLAMEFVPGETLVDRIEREQTLPERDVLEIGRAIALGLAAAWKQGLVHRDIKPENILLGKNGLVKISDFGLAKDRTGGLKTTVGITFGTPHYMSPEQVQGDADLDTRCDLYALGATMYHALGGRFPYDGESDVEIMVKHLEEKPVPLREINPEISLPAATLIASLMERERDDRPSAPDEVVAEIDQILDGTWSPRKRAPLTRRIMKSTHDAGRDLSGRIRHVSGRVAESPRARTIIYGAAFLAVLAFAVHLVAYYWLRQ